MKTIELNDVKYEIIKDYNDAIEKEETSSKLTDYFDEYDYIVGDWAYSKLRLKGFYEDSNPKAKKDNSFSSIENYIKNYCAYGCKHFVLKKI